MIIGFGTTRLLTRVVNDTFQKYRRYSISIPALKVSSIPIPIPNRKSIDIDTDISISILSFPIFAETDCLHAWSTDVRRVHRTVSQRYSAIHPCVAVDFDVIKIYILKLSLYYSNILVVFYDC